uniref:Uncharacterized protein n=1 Tax=Periophthalmus magnuspinnatus TaxID=409849 RepID=A0A3B4BG54_9GOBI
MSKNKLLNIKDKIDGNEVDLSLGNLTEVPVRELVRPFNLGFFMFYTNILARLWF